jgi:hypothetical protein
MVVPCDIRYLFVSLLLAGMLRDRLAFIFLSRFMNSTTPHAVIQSLLSHIPEISVALNREI